MSTGAERSALDLQEVHLRVQELLRSRVNPEKFEAWCQALELVALDEREVTFRVPSVFVRDRVRRNFLAPLRASVIEALGLETDDVVLRIDAQADRVASAAELAERGELDLRSGRAELGELEGREVLGDRSLGDRDLGDAHAEVDARPAAGSQVAGSHVAGSQVAGVQYGTRSASPAVSSPLNRNYTFETFVVGPCNRLSHAAALAVGDNPGRAYNPLFVHGDVGLGKTHLLQAICHSVQRRRDAARVLYMSCEDFTNRFIHSIQNGQLDDFREFHRGVDVLVIDDVQFLANKDKTQEEFFHTFNALYNTNRQIVISSDRSPTEIPTIEERLVSRFKWGLVAEMEVPCFETRVAIVRRKARLRGVEIPDDVAWFVAERIDTNIRELEGAVIKVIGVASITERELTRELAEEALKGVVVSRSRKLTLADIMGKVTAHFSVSARELTGKGRTQAVSLPRQICMYLCRKNTEHSLEEIGRFFGNRDHTTVIYAVSRVQKRLKDDRMFQELISTLSGKLRQ